MMTAFSCIIFLKNWTIVSNFKFIPYFNILQNFVQNVRKPKWPFILSWAANQLSDTPFCPFFHPESVRPTKAIKENIRKNSMMKSPEKEQNLVIPTIYVSHILNIYSCCVVSFQLYTMYIFLSM